MAIETEDKSYELAYGLKRLEMAEAGVGNVAMATLFQNRPTTGQLITFAAYGLREQGSPAWLNPKRATDLLSGWMESERGGYGAPYSEVTQAIERDCGFLFR